MITTDKSYPFAEYLFADKLIRNELRQKHPTIDAEWSRIVGQIYGEIDRMPIAEIQKLAETNASPEDAIATQYHRAAARRLEQRQNPPKQSQARTTSKEKFTKHWGNQTDIGRHYGMSAIALGRFLTEQGLKDGKHATTRAVDEEYAKYTPLKNETPFYMWNREKIGTLLDTAGKTKKSPIEFHVADITAKINALNARAEKDPDEELLLSKFGYYLFEDMLNEVPLNIRNAVRARLEASEVSC